MCALTLDQVVDAALGVLRNLALLEAHIPTLHPLTPAILRVLVTHGSDVDIADNVRVFLQCVAGWVEEHPQPLLTLEDVPLLLQALQVPTESDITVEALLIILQYMAPCVDDTLPAVERTSLAMDGRSHRVQRQGVETATALLTREVGTICT